MNPRLWVYSLLTTDAGLIAQIPAAFIFAGGSLTERPNTDRFVIYRLHDEASLLNGDDAPAGVGRTLELWVYGPPGQYDDIDTYLETARVSLNTQVALPGGVACRWQGDSPELFDDALKSSVRFGTYQVIRKVA
jgi:hypothetical protein